MLRNFFSSGGLYAERMLCRDCGWLKTIEATSLEGTQAHTQDHLAQNPGHRILYRQLTRSAWEEEQRILRTTGRKGLIAHYVWGKQRHG